MTTQHSASGVFFSILAGRAIVCREEGFVEIEIGKNEAAPCSSDRLTAFRALYKDVYYVPLRLSEVLNEAHSVLSSEWKKERVLELSLIALDPSVPADLRERACSLAERLLIDTIASSSLESILLATLPPLGADVEGALRSAFKSESHRLIRILYLVQDSIDKAYEKIRGVSLPFDRTVFIAATPERATEDLLSGESSRRHGGRWNPAGLFPAVYAWLSPKAALEEQYARCRRAGLPMSASGPFVVVAIRVSLSRLVDLQNDTTITQVFGVTIETLRNIDWLEALRQGEEPVTHVISRTAREAGCEGLLVPSESTFDGTGIVLFPDRLGAPDSVKFVKTEASTSTFSLMDGI
jgi:RES domain-containing protein